jgi:hypothetical protein
MIQRFIRGLDFLNKLPGQVNDFVVSRARLGMRGAAHMPPCTRHVAIGSPADGPPGRAGNP